MLQGACDQTQLGLIASCRGDERIRALHEMADHAQAVTSSPARIAERYEVIKSLGHGGMARVYHVRDSVTGRELALKQFVPTNDKHHSTVLGFFEAEFHALSQLSHPRVIEV